MIFHWKAVARADLRRVAQPQARAVLYALTRYGNTGAGDVARLADKEFEGLLRLRVSDYHVFLRHESDGAITVLRVLHRSEAYR